MERPSIRFFYFFLFDFLCCSSFFRILNKPVRRGWYGNQWTSSSTHSIGVASCVMSHFVASLFLICWDAGSEEFKTPKKCEKKVRPSSSDYGESYLFTSSLFLLRRQSIPRNIPAGEKGKGLNFFFGKGEKSLLIWKDFFSLCLKRGDPSTPVEKNAWIPAEENGKKAVKTREISHFPWLTLLYELKYFFFVLWEI